MSMPFYVPAEQMMKDKADFARKGIARGRALVAMEFADGILICAENSSSTLRKVSEIYDRIAFAGAGKYNEYDRLRIAGVRHADLKGYSFSREDVDAQSLANAYAQMLGDVFTHEVKPMEVEIVVAELGETSDDDRLFHILYDGTVVDEQGFTVLGGASETILDRVRASYQPGRALADAVRSAVGALAGDDRQLDAGELEIAVLQRGNGRRSFHRLTDSEKNQILGDGAAPAGEVGAEAAPAELTEAEPEPESEPPAEPEAADETPPTTDDEG